MSDQQQQQQAAPEPMEDDAAPQQQQQQQQGGPPAAAGGAPAAAAGGGAAHQLAQLLQAHMDHMAQLAPGLDADGEDLDYDEVEYDEVDYDEDEVEDADEIEYGELDDWFNEDDVEQGDGLDSDIDADEEADIEDTDVFDDDQDADHLTVRQRIQLECGVLHHNAHLTTADQPTRHTGVLSAAHHHQTADALTHLPAPTPPEAAAAVAAAAAAGEGPEGGGSSSAAAAASSFVLEVPPEDVVVSCKGVLSVYRLVTGQPAKLMARSKTLFRHYSIAASLCGNYVAATGSSGLVSLFRVQRSNTKDSTAPAEDAQEAAAAASRASAPPNPNIAAAPQVPFGQQMPELPAVGDGDAAAFVTAFLNPPYAQADVRPCAGGPDVDPGDLEWQLVHVATLLCKNGPEVMVNSVRFGHFAGQLRMLVAHQDGMLYLFNLPQVHTAGSKQKPAAVTQTAAAASGRAAGGPSAPTANAAALAGEAAALMVQNVPDWEPLGSQINRCFVEQLMSLLPPSQQAAAAAAATGRGGGQAASAVEQPGSSQQRQQQQQQQQKGGQLPKPARWAERQAARMAHAAAAAAGSSSDAGPDSSLGVAEGSDADGGEPTAAPVGTLRHTLQALNMGERVFGVLLSWMKDNGRCPDIDQYAAYSTLLSTWQGQWARQAQQMQQQLNANSNVQVVAFQPPGFNPWAYGCTASTADPWYSGSACTAKAQILGQILQDEACLKELQILERHRLSFNTSDDWVANLPKSEAAGNWAGAVDALRAAAAGQWALLGAAGEDRQQQQWQRQQSEGDTDRDAAVVRAVYLLLLLRVLGPITTPTIKQGARVVVLRHGPQEAAHRRLSHAEITSAPRLTTCAITRLAKDDKAAEAARVALAQANADLNLLLNNPNVNPQLQGAAQIAIADAARMAAQEHLLPLNIVEASPDGQWLAVGADQLAVVLVPAGAGYNHQICHTLDLCPLVAPRPSAAWHMHQGTLGCQYMSFNSSSTMLAASSDAMRLVVVWGVAGPSLGQRLASFSLHNRAVLPLRFMPPYHPLTALQQGVAAAARAAATASAAAEAAAAGVGPVSAAGVLQMHAGPGAVSSAAVAAADVLEAGSVGQLCDRLLAYCELYGGLHLADMSVFVHAGQPVPPHTSTTHPISSHFCIKTYVELSPKRKQQQDKDTNAAAAAAAADAADQPAEPAAAAAAAAAADGGPAQQQQQQQQGDDADAEMAEAQPDPAQAAAEAFLDAFNPGWADPPPAAAAAGGGDGVGAPAAAVAAAGGVSEDLDASRAPRINGLVVTPAGRVLVACPHELLEWQLITRWSHTYHKRLPAGFRAAVKTLLMAAALNHGSASPAPEAGQAGTPDNTGSGGSSSQQLLSRLPGPVLEQVFDSAALPQGVWAAAAVPTYTQLCEALDHRPQPPHDAAVLGWPDFMGV